MLHQLYRTPNSIASVLYGGSYRIVSAASCLCIQRCSVQYNSEPEISLVGLCDFGFLGSCADLESVLGRTHSNWKLKLQLIDPHVHPVKYILVLEYWYVPNVSGILQREGKSMNPSNCFSRPGVT